jgi:hypothetical protein
VFDTANFVGAYTAAQLQGVAQKARDMAANGASFADPVELARSIYREALGAEILQDVTAAELIAALFVQQESGSYEPRTDTPLSEIAVPRLQGGTLLHRLCDIVSIHTENDLTPGDLILCYWSGVYRLFVCVGEGELVQIDTASRTATLVQNGSDLALYQNDSYCINSICSQLRTYELCAVLRPAMKGAQ